MEEDYRRLEESYRRLEEQCRFYEGRCKALKEENDALREKCDAYEKKERDVSEKRRMAVNVRWEKRRKKASDAVSPSDPCLLTLFARKRNLSDSERNVPVAPSKREIMDINEQGSKADVALSHTTMSDALSHVTTERALSHTTMSDALSHVTTERALSHVTTERAWQQEEERREKFRAGLYQVEPISFQKPTEEQVYEYMHTYTMGAWYIDARDEARQFMDFYDARGWMMGQNPMRDWRAAARNWINMRINKIKNGNNRKQQADYENDRGYYGAIRSIEEDARYKREHGEPELHY